MRLALGCKTWTLALILALGCSSSPPKKNTGGGTGGEDTGGSPGSTGGSPGTGGSGTGGKATGGSPGTGGKATGGTGGSDTGGSGGADAGADAAADAAGDDAAADAATPDLAPDAPPVVYEMPRAPWLGRDIGPTGMQAGGVFLATTPNGGQNYDLISSGTTGIGGTADAFFYMHQSVSGPGVISARLVSLAMTNANSAGGLMIRESLMPDAAMVFIGATGDGTVGGKVIVRTARGQAATSVPMDTTLPGLKAANGTMLRLVREGNVVRIYAGAPNTIETDAALVGGGMVTLTLQNPNGPVLYGAVSTSGDAMNPTRARFNELALHNLGSRPVTAAWTHYAIGTSGQSAIWSGVGNAARLTVSGNGQPWGTVMGTSRDFLGFAYERNNDSNSLRVLVESQTISDANSRVAVMIRDVSGNGLPRSATTIALSLTQGVGLVLERRAASNDNSELEKIATVGQMTAPLWLRLDKAVIPRVGDPLGTTDTYVTAYYTENNNGNPRLPWKTVGPSFVYPATNANPPGLGIGVASFSPTQIHSAIVQVQTGAAAPPPDGGIPADASPDAEPDAGADAATD
ncbi:MAG TPA: hypothetical protein VN914_00090 [Polyangia bacterium]|nr:hypothetical protein [Polyangia bacterium]